MPHLLQAQEKRKKREAICCTSFMFLAVKDFKILLENTCPPYLNYLRLLSIQRQRCLRQTILTSFFQVLRLVVLVMDSAKVGWIDKRRDEKQVKGINRISTSPLY